MRNIRHKLTSGARELISTLRSTPFSELVRRPELPALVVLLVVFGATSLFIKLADEVREGETADFDQRVVQALRDPDNPRMPRGPWWLVEAGKDITALGGSTVLTLVTLAAAGYLLLLGKSRAMCLMLLAVTTGALLSNVLKMVFARERPPTGSDLVNVITYSFPSGHSMLSAVVYLVLGAILAETEPRRIIRLYFLGLAVVLTVLIGISRVYLGVHYPTDVLAGWTMGLAWALLWWLIGRFLQRRGEVESATGGTGRGSATVN